MGRRIKKEVKQFNVGDFVFAKVRGFRAWPARVLRKDMRRMYQVYFYGTCNIARVGISQIFDYEKHKLRMGDVKRRANRSFKNAMEHIGKSLIQPQQDQGYFQAKSDLESEDAELQNETSSSNESSTASSLELVVGRKLSKLKLPFIHITGDSD